MVIETDVLRGNRSIHQIWRKLVKCDEGPVLYMKGGEDLAVLGDYLSGELAVWILKFLE